MSAVLQCTNHYDSFYSLRRKMSIKFRNEGTSVRGELLPVLTGENRSFSATYGEESVTRDPLVPVSLIKVQALGWFLYLMRRKQQGSELSISTAAESRSCESPQPQSQGAVNLHSRRVRELSISTAAESRSCEPPQPQNRGAGGEERRKQAG